MHNWGLPLTLLLLVALLPGVWKLNARPSNNPSTSLQQRAEPGQLFAVRGEIVKVSSSGKGLLTVTVQPAKEFSAVSVLAGENDLVGHAVGRVSGVDILGLLAGDEQDDETITAAELSEGDIVSVIYDPKLQNKALEIYIR